MNPEPSDPIEQQIVAVRPSGAPVDLRGKVLAGVAHELRTSRWDRRLAKAAAVLLVVGIGLNAAVALRIATPNRSSLANVAQSSPQQLLLETAVIIAEATDAATGIRFAHQVAAISGRELTPTESAAIDAAVHRATSNSNRG